jgi:hypothetical protein
MQGGVIISLTRGQGLSRASSRSFASPTFRAFNLQFCRRYITLRAPDDYFRIDIEFRPE